MNGDQIIFIVDDDDRVREALCELFRSADMRAVAFKSAGDYAAFPRPDVPGCLILDVGAADSSAPEVQRQIATDHPPIVFITGRDDVPASVRSTEDGLVRFLTKPFNEADLMDAVHAAIETDRRMRLQQG